MPVAEFPERRFPPPCGQKLTFVYFEEEPGRRAAAKLLTRDEAQDRGQRRQTRLGQ